MKFFNILFWPRNLFYFLTVLACEVSAQMKGSANLILLNAIGGLMRGHALSIDFNRFINSAL